MLEGKARLRYMARWDSGMVSVEQTQFVRSTSPVAQTWYKWHFTVLIRPRTTPPNQTPSVNIISKRDLRPSRIRDWSLDYTIRLVRCFGSYTCQEKYDLFNSTLVEVVNYYLPVQRTKCCSSDKLLITHKLKSLIIKRQKALVVYGKESQHYKKVA